MNRWDRVLALLITLAIITFAWAVIWSGKENSRRSCIASAQLMGVQYTWDLRYECALQINGHWWYVSAVSPAVAP